jgi:hypothetical protein
MHVVFGRPLATGRAIPKLSPRLRPTDRDVGTTEYRGGDEPLPGTGVGTSQSFGQLDADRARRDVDRPRRKALEDASGRLGNVFHGLVVHGLMAIAAVSATPARQGTSQSGTALSTLKRLPSQASGSSLSFRSCSPTNPYWVFRGKAEQHSVHGEP